VKRALVVNAYAQGNWGDSAIVEGVIDSLRSAGFDHVALAPVDWRTRSTGRLSVDADEVVPPLVNLYDVPKWLRRPRPAMLAYAVGRMAGYGVGRPRDEALRSYRQADVIVSVGGAYLGGSKLGSNLIKAMNIRAGVMTGRPTFVAPITVNPFSANVGRILHWGLHGASLFARDAQTMTRFREAGLEGVLVPDIAFRAPTLLRQAASSADAGPRTGTPTIGWAPRGYRRDHRAWGDPEAAERLTLSAVRRILGASDDRLRFIPHVRAGTTDDDLDAVNRLLAQLTPAERERAEVAKTPETLEDAVRQYADVDVLVTSRMHAAIFALAVGTPAIAVAYEPKVAGVMADVGLADRVVPADARLSVAALIDLVARLRSPVERARTREAYARVQGRFAAFDTALRTAAGQS